MARDVSEAVGIAASDPRPCRRPSDLTADKDCFVLPAVGPLSPAPREILHTPSLKGCVADGGGGEDGLFEGGLLSAGSGQIAWVHILALPLRGCDLGSARASVPPSAKWECEEHFNPHTRRQDFGFGGASRMLGTDWNIHRRENCYTVVANKPHRR